MKKLLLFALLFSGCASNELTPADTSKFVLNNNLKEINLSSPREGYDETHGQYKAYVMVHNLQAPNISDYNIKAEFQDGNGKVIAYTEGAVPGKIEKGDSIKMTLAWVFAKDSLPKKVVFSASKQ